MLLGNILAKVLLFREGLGISGVGPGMSGMGPGMSGMAREVPKGVLGLKNVMERHENTRIWMGHYDEARWGH